MALDLTAINGTLDNMTSTLNEMLASFGSKAPSTPSSFGIPQNSLSTVVNVGASDALNAFSNDVVNGINSTLHSAFDGIQTDFSNLENGITGTITTAFNGVTSAFQTVKNNIEAGLGTLAQDVQSGINGLAGFVVNGFNTVVGDITGTAQALGSAIESGISTVVKGVTSEVSQIAGVVQQGLGIAAQTIVQTGEQTLGAIESIPKAVAGLATDILSGLGKVILTTAEDVWQNAVTQDVVKGLETGARDLGAWYKDILVGLVTEFLPFTDEPPDAHFAKDVTRIGAAALMEQVAGSLEEATPQVAFLISALLNKVIENIDIGSYRDLQYIGNWQEPNVVPGVGELIEAYWRGNIDESTYGVQMQKLGFSKLNADILYGNSVQYLGVAQLVDAYYRGIVKDTDTLYKSAQLVHANKTVVDAMVKMYEQLVGSNTSIEFWRRGIVPTGWTDAFDDMRAAGFTKERIEAYKEASYNLPGIFQLQDFKVRGVDNPATVEKFQLDYGVDDAYFEGARKLGWTKEDAQRIYRSYWEYPPFFILVSEYKSGAIDEATFRDVMAALRFTPYWIDQFAKQLAPKLTQADIKDLYKYQVITADEIPKKLESIGIAGSLADELKQLWVASVKLAAPVDQTAAQAASAKIKGLSETIVKENYIDGAITKDQAVQYLTELGYPNEEIQLNMNTWDITIHKAIVSQTIADLKEQARAKAITMNDAATAIQALNLNPLQVETYLTEIQQLLTSKPKVPTLAEVTKWFKDSLLTTQEYINGLELLGYDQQWIPYYLVAAGMTTQEVQQLGLTFSAFGG